VPCLVGEDCGINVSETVDKVGGCFRFIQQLTAVKVARLRFPFICLLTVPRRVIQLIKQSPQEACLGG